MDSSGTCGFSCSSRIVRYAAPSAPASMEFVSMRRKRIRQVYTRAVGAEVRDIDARVARNQPLSADYNVLSFEAPEIAAHARPGQFVMVQPSRGLDPLLRRPFSIFEVLRDSAGKPSGISIFNKRIGSGTSLLASVEE